LVPVSKVELACDGILLAWCGCDVKDAQRELCGWRHGAGRPTKKMSEAGRKEYYLPERLDGGQLEKHTRKDFDNVYESVSARRYNSSSAEYEQLRHFNNRSMRLEIE
jgi:hypothetical protein